MPWAGEEEDDELQVEELTAVLTHDAEAVNSPDPERESEERDIEDDIEDSSKKPDFSKFEKSCTVSPI